MGGRETIVYLGGEDGGADGVHWGVDRERWVEVTRAQTDSPKSAQPLATSLVLERMPGRDSQDGRTKTDFALLRTAMSGHERSWMTMFLDNQLVVLGRTLRSMQYVTEAMDNGVCLKDFAHLVRFPDRIRSSVLHVPMRRRW